MDDVWYFNVYLRVLEENGWYLKGFLGIWFINDDIFI